MQLRILLLALVVCAPLAAAHAELLSSDPQNGARLDTSPGRVIVTLTEAIEPSATTMDAFDANGTSIAAGDVSIQGGNQPVLTLPIKQNLEPGVYRATWKILSKDSHTVTGSIVFAVGPVSAPAPETQPNYATDSQAAIARFLVYAGYSLVFGAVGALWWLRPDSPNGLARFALMGALLHLGGVALLLLRTSVDSGQDLQGLLATGVGRALYGRAILGVGMVVLAIVAMAGRSRVALPMVAVLAIGAAAANAAYSHAFREGLAAQSFDFLHIISTSAWVGGLVVFMAALRGAPAEQVRSWGVRFGNLALACVIVLALTGTIVAVQLLGPLVLNPAALAASPWGLLLGAKIALALAMVAVGAINRYVLLAEPAPGGVAGTMQRTMASVSGGRVRPAAVSERPVRAAARAEALMGIIILVLAGFLTSISPPATVAAAVPEVLDMQAQGDFYVVEARFGPVPHVGESSQVEFMIKDATTGAPVEGNTCGRLSCIEATVTSAGQTAANRPDVLDHGGGTWLIHSVLWPSPGNATLTLTISTPQHYSDTVTFAIKVLP